MERAARGSAALVHARTGSHRHGARVAGRGPSARAAPACPGHGAAAAACCYEQHDAGASAGRPARCRTRPNSADADRRDGQDASPWSRTFRACPTEQCQNRRFPRDCGRRRRSPRLGPSQRRLVLLPRYMMKSDETLRSERLVFYENDIERLDAELDSVPRALEGALRPSGRQGRPPRNAPRRHHRDVPRLHLGADRRFLRGHQGDGPPAGRGRVLRSSFTRGRDDSIQLQLVGNRTLLAALFDARTNLGMVRFYAQETSERLDGDSCRDNRGGARPRPGPELWRERGRRAGQALLEGRPF